ncbi:unnamed protein product [Rangifer tarandus platyrhynchus]|uniref:Uncharacterized protein n=2 Tax=Rangifer tarandus platyrhynchus TaxID=3082113 RepID=A0ABN8YMG0_RANTA|nr:unnamed protein product [Rangifer tarandus platyrhynchus]CAI9696882.1 unnamed protein product [Rangifer tarandus platyrhynchus]
MRGAPLACPRPTALGFTSRLPGRRRERPGCWAPSRYAVPVPLNPSPEKDGGNGGVWGAAAGPLFPGRSKQERERETLVRLRGAARK